MIDTLPTFTYFYLFDRKSNFLQFVLSVSVCVLE
jgi:hypothetical protein